MKTVYGKWTQHTSVHAVGYDGKWICGMSGITSSECNEDLSWVDCKLCLKKLDSYVKKFVVPSSLVMDLKESFDKVESLMKNLKGDKSGCICNTPGGYESYIKTWILPDIKRMLNHFEKDCVVKK